MRVSCIGGSRWNAEYRRRTCCRWLNAVCSTVCALRLAFPRDFCELLLFVDQILANLRPTCHINACAMCVTGRSFEAWRAANLARLALVLMLQRMALVPELLCRTENAGCAQQCMGKVPVVSCR